MAHSYAPNVGAQVRRMTGDVFAYRENTSEGVREYNEVQHFGLAASVRSFLLASCLPHTSTLMDEKLMANAFAHTQIFRKKGRTRPYVRGDYSVNPNILMSCCVESTNDMYTMRQSESPKSSKAQFRAFDFHESPLPMLCDHHRAKDYILDQIMNGNVPPVRALLRL